ncbi:MAG: SpoIIE family protein phosphatase [Spirochaetales bacterium]|nr:SpoIIE family protein phosphatase [Spirochaetales bacterium]
MKLSVRLPLYHSLAVLLFILSLGLAIFIFQEMDRLNNQKILLDNLHSNVLILNDELTMLQYKPQIPSVGYFKLSQQIYQIERIINELKANQERSRGETSYKENTDIIIHQWDSLGKTYMDPLQEEMRNFKPLAGYYYFTLYGMKRSLMLFSLDEDQELFLKLQTILDLVGGLQTKITINLAIATESTAEMVGKEIDQFSRKMLRNAAIATAVMFGLSLILAWYLSHSISESIKKLDKAISEVASGNFHYSLQSSDIDEFKEIAQGFNTLTEMLWFRLDSLKDIMRDVGSAVENRESASELYTLVLELAIDSTEADSAVLLLYDEDENGLRVAEHLGYFPPPMTVPQLVRVKRDTIKEWFNSTLIPMEGNILGDSCSRGSSFYIHDNESQRVFPENSDRSTSNFISSSIILSLGSAEEKIGAIGLVKTTPGAFFNDLDYTYMKSFANFVTITLDNFEKYQELVKKHEINREIEVAAEIQNTLLPGKMPPMKGTKIAAFSHAAKGVSGDYYDVFTLDKERTAVIICDVSGKGIPASLFMVMFRTVLRTISAPQMNAAQILTALNSEISGNFQSGTFATASLLIMNHRDNTISYSNGAHHPLYIYRNSKKSFVRFDTDGLPLGIDMRAEYGHKQIRVEGGDYLFLFTDGLTEARNMDGEELGTGRLLKYASQYTDKSPDRMKEVVEELLAGFEGEAGQHDDETFMAIRIG